MMTLADSVWLATALLHRESSTASDFSVQEIIKRASDEKLVRGFTPGLPVYTSKHCVANKAPNPGRYRILIETTRGRRRLFKNGDPFHPDRKGGKIRPDRADLPLEYQPLVDWYDEAYSKQPANSPLSLAVSHRFPADANSDPPAIADFDELHSHTEFVGPGGTVVLPKYLQEVLRLKEGSCLSIYRDNDRIILLPITDEYISKMRGSLKGDYSLQDDREREHRIEKER